MPVELSPSEREHYLHDNEAKRNDVNAAIGTAVTDADKQSVVEDVVQKVKDAETVAEAASNAAAANTHNGSIDSVPQSEIANARIARGALMRLLQISRKRDTGDVPPINPILIPEHSQKLLSALDAKFQNNFSDTTAVILYPLVIKAINHDLSADELTQEFNAMRGRLHPTTLTKMSEVLIERSADYGMSEVDAKDRFDVGDVTMAKEVRRTPWSEREKTLYKEILNDIDAHPFSGSTVEETTNNRHKLWSAINNGDRDEVKRILTGWSDAKVDDLLRLSNQEAQNGGDDALGLYGINPEDVMIFHSQYVESHFDDYFERVQVKGKYQYQFRSAKVDEMIEAIYHATNNITAGARANPESEWRDNYNDLQEGRAVRELRNKLYEIAENPRIHRLLVDETSRWALRDSCYAIASEIDFEISAREA